MMSLWKLRVGVESYYLAQVASGLDEYYTGSGEATGSWAGAGANLLGLDGSVGAADLRAVLAGLAPGTGHRADTEWHTARRTQSAGARFRSHLLGPEVGVSRLRARPCPSVVHPKDGQVDGQVGAIVNSSPCLTCSDLRG